MRRNETLKGLTEYYENNEQTIYNSLLLRIANKAVSFDIESKIDNVLTLAKKDRKFTNNKKQLQANLTYFKYKILSSPYNKNKNLDAAKKYLKNAYKLGSPDAAAQYGYDHYTGTGTTTEINKEKAKDYFNKAQKSSFYSNYVEFLLGKCIFREQYKETSHNKEEVQKAINYFEKSLSKNVFESKIYLAYCYLWNKTNLDLAEKYFKDEKTENNSYDFELARIKLLKKMYSKN